MQICHRLITNVADLEEGRSDAEIDAEIWLVTCVVFTRNVALVLPLATATLADTVAEPLLLDSVMRTPPVGAAVPNVIVPVTFLPPTTLAGLRVTERMTGGFTVRFVVCDDPP